MTATTTARVEVLTAEVRVLMVGSRQVTMSVYNQLDRVALSQIEPFGRVHPRDAEPGMIYVVGASTRDADRGTLVRSQRESCMVLVRQADQRRNRADMITERGELTQQREKTDWRDWDRTAAAKRLNQLDAILATETRTVAQVIAESGELMAAAKAAAPWDALPLIVLAGLR
jgi:hypothetical protein